MASDSGEHPKIDPLVELLGAMRSVETTVRETHASAHETQRSVKAFESVMRDWMNNITSRVVALEVRMAAVESSHRGDSLNTRREFLEHARREVDRALENLTREEINRDAPR